MAWMRAVAGANLITSFRVIYQLVGLTTTGASSATAYAPFSFSLVGAAARIPPANINIYSDGVLLTVGTDYSYNSTTGAVTIYRVAGDIVVEAIGKVATIIYTPNANYTNFIIVSTYSVQVNTTTHRATQNNNGYWLIWSQGDLQYDLLLDATGSTAATRLAYYGYIIRLKDVYYAVFATAAEALMAAYMKTTAYTYVQSINIRYSNNVGGGTTGFFAGAAYGRYTTYRVPTYITVQLHTSKLWYDGWISSYGTEPVYERPEYDVIQPQ